MGLDLLNDSAESPPANNMRNKTLATLGRPAQPLLPGPMTRPLPAGGSGTPGGPAWKGAARCQALHRVGLGAARRPRRHGSTLRWGVRPRGACWGHRWGTAELRQEPLGRRAATNTRGSLYPQAARWGSSAPPPRLAWRGYTASSPWSDGPSSKARSPSPEGGASVSLGSRHRVGGLGSDGVRLWRPCDLCPSAAPSVKGALCQCGVRNTGPRDVTVCGNGGV